MVKKTRDQSTGHITDYKLSGEVEGKSVLIVDDICDGGMTFKLLAEELMEAGAVHINLYVTHGIFSKGLRTLFESGIEDVFTRKGRAVASDSYGNIGYKPLKGESV